MGWPYESVLHRVAAALENIAAAIDRWTAAFVRSLPPPPRLPRLTFGDALPLTGVHPMPKYVLPVTVTILAEPDPQSDVVRRELHMFVDGVGTFSADIDGFGEVAVPCGMVPENAAVTVQVVNVDHAGNRSVAANVEGVATDTIAPVGPQLRVVFGDSSRVDDGVSNTTIDPHSGASAPEPTTTGAPAAATTEEPGTSTPAPPATTEEPATTTTAAPVVDVPSTDAAG